MKVMIDETTYEGSGASKKLAKQVIFKKSSQTCSANMYACYDSCLLTVVFNDGFWWFDRPVLELHWLAFTSTPLPPTSRLDPETKNSKTLFQVDLKPFTVKFSNIWWHPLFKMVNFPLVWRGIKIPLSNTECWIRPFLVILQNLGGKRLNKISLVGNVFLIGTILALLGVTAKQSYLHKKNRDCFTLAQICGLSNCRNILVPSACILLIVLLFSS